MKFSKLSGTAGLSTALLSSLAWSSPTIINPQYTMETIAVFLVIIAITAAITYFVSKKVQSASDFYTAGGGITGAQNGWAIAGDYLSAASFLGIAGLIALYGYDGFMYSVGFLVAYVTVLLLIAEPCRNIGKYTLADILAFRNDPKKVKILGALSTITVSTFYLTAQMVGGGVLVKTLIGIDYNISVTCVGVLMLMYVLFGGMIATTWVQVIKAVLLVTSSFVIVVMVWAPYGFSLPGFLNDIVNDPKIQAQVTKLLGAKAAGLSPEDLGHRFLEPALLFTNPLDQISLGLALVLGTAGLPHILMRFFTVATPQEARKSVVWAMIIIGLFYTFTFIMGLGAALKVGPGFIAATDRGGNMAAPLLAQYIGGGADSALGNMSIAFIAAIAFTTIVAVVSGLVLASASAIAHDIYIGLIKKGEASQKEQVAAARVSTLFVGTASIIIGILAKGQNVAHLVGLAFAVAASANLPCIILTLYWKRCNTNGIIGGMLLGTVAAIGLVMLSPNMTYPKLVKANAEKVVNGIPAQGEKPAVKGTTQTIAELEAKVKSLSGEEKVKTEELLKKTKVDDEAAKAAIEKFKDEHTSIMGLEEPLFKLKNPGIISIPLGFLAVILFSLISDDKRSREKWNELYVRQNTGIGLSKASQH